MLSANASIPYLLNFPREQRIFLVELKRTILRASCLHHTGCTVSNRRNRQF